MPKSFPVIGSFASHRKSGSRGTLADEASALRIVQCSSSRLAHGDVYGLGGGSVHAKHQRDTVAGGRPGWNCHVHLREAHGTGGQTGKGRYGGPSSNGNDGGD